MLLKLKPLASAENSSAAKPLPVEDLGHVLSYTRDLWSEARGCRFFITGGTGFFGMWLLESFAHINDALGLGMSATVLTRDPEKFAATAPHLAVRPDLTFLQGDVRRFEFPEGTYDYVIHGATTSGGPVEPLEMLETIIDGTRRVLDFAGTHGARKFLFLSSGAVYGTQPPELSHIPESFTGGPDPLDPNSAYGEGKRVGELLSVLKSRASGFEAKIARCFAFVGPHLPLNAHFAVGNFIRDALNGGPIHVSGDGTPMRSYLYAADLAIWLWKILFVGISHRAYNVGSADALSIMEIAGTVKQALSLSGDVEVAQKTSAHSPPSRYVPCVDRAEQELGFYASTSLTNSIRRTAGWH